MRKLGIDFGTKTCGFAISDSNNLIATGLTSFSYENNNYMLIIQKIKKILNSYNNEIDEIIVGYPTMNITGMETKTSLLINKLVKLINEHITNIKVIKWNENYTTKMANEYLIKFEIKASKRKKIIDMVSATFILQSYLDSLKQ